MPKHQRFKHYNILDTKELPAAHCVMPDKKMLVIFAVRFDNSPIEWFIFEIAFKSDLVKLIIIST